MQAKPVSSEPQPFSSAKSHLRTLHVAPHRTVLYHLVFLLGLHDYKLPKGSAVIGLPTHNKEGKRRCGDGGSGGDNLPHKAAKHLAKRLKGKCFHQGSVHR